MLKQRYELQAQLSADDQGVDYRALDRETQQPVDIRFLKPEIETLWPHVVRRCQLAMLINSHGARGVLEFERDISTPYLVLESRPVQSLDELFASRRPVFLNLAILILSDIARVLTAAHTMGLGHGQLTPKNIGWSGTLDEPGHCFLDFTRCPTNLKLGLTDDVLQLSQLWNWMLGEPAAELPNADQYLEQLSGDMQSAEPENRPAINQVAKRLDEWLHRKSITTTSIANAAAAAHSDSGSPYPEPQTFPDDERMDRTFIASAATMSELATADQSESAPGDPRTQQRRESTSTGATDPLTNRPTLGRFRLQSKLGEGGMGAVWRAVDPLDGTIVAIKVLRTDMAQKADVLKRFQREAMLLAEVRNPYVANMLEINTDGEIHYLVLEFVDGSDLQHYLHEHGHLKERIAASITADVARALCDAHKRGIVHRDLKPENILLQNQSRHESDGAAGTSAEFPRVKLTDFGLARNVNDTELMHLTSAGSVLGTPLYLAPEQCTGRPDVDARADVYSLGATLFHTLIGRPPFEAGNLIGLITKHVNEPAARVRTLIPELSEAIDEIVAKCLQKNPNSRYQNASELLRDLERLLRGEPTSIIAHPRLPTANPKDVLSFVFTWELNNSPEALWPHVSNTERLNRAIGLPAVAYTTEADSNGDSRRLGQFQKLGMTFGWQEHPFEWIESRRMGVFREFHAGPWKWFTSIVELTPRADGGTMLVHRIQILPASFLGKTAGKISIGLQTRKSLEQVYRRIDTVLSGELGSLADPFERPHQLSADGLRKLDQRLQKVTRRGVEPFVVERFREYLSEAPVQELARIRPLSLAQKLSLDDTQLVSACLIGAHEGLLTMLWDIVCPICRIPSQVQDSLKSLQDHGHCEACQSDFDLDFANSIELIFRIASDIQATDTGVFCIGGPAHSPHVVAQVRLAPAERFELDLALSQGAYRVRGPQLSYAVDFRVVPNATASRWELSLARGPQADLPSQLKPDDQLFVLENDTLQEVVIRVERMASRADALTAARAAATPLFRELFPGECLAPDQLVRVEQVTLLFTKLEAANQLYFELGDSPAFARLHEHFRTLDTLIRHAGGSLIKTVGDGVHAVFSDPVQAIRAALAIKELKEPQLRIAVHQGPAMVATINEHLDYFGSTVSMTCQALEIPRTSEIASSPCLLITNSMSRNPQVIDAINQVDPQAILNTVPNLSGTLRDGLLVLEVNINVAN